MDRTLILMKLKNLDFEIKLAPEPDYTPGLYGKGSYKRVMIPRDVMLGLFPGAVLNSQSRIFLMCLGFIIRLDLGSFGKSESSWLIETFCPPNFDDPDHFFSWDREDGEVFTDAVREKLKQMRRDYCRV